MRQAVRVLVQQTSRKGLVDITPAISRWIGDQGIATGLLTVFCRHTSASLLVGENADPSVRHDIAAYFERLAPEHGPYSHTLEGPDDMPAHLRAALTQTSLAVPVGDGRPMLGTWQGIFLFEHRARPHRREIVLHLIGE